LKIRTTIKAGAIMWASSTMDGTNKKGIFLLNYVGFGNG
jgi:hypothetical protein